MLPIDSLVVDLIFQADAEPDMEALIEALGGRDWISERKLIDPDMIDPTFEMTVAPSMPFRRRGERRLIIIDDTVAPMREKPEESPVTTIDLRPEKERLVRVCQLGFIRLGRLNGLGVLGDAVLVAREARDLRGIALLPWVLDPTTDVDGKRRANRLTQQEFEEKLLAYEKRLEELDDETIIGRLGSANFLRVDDLLVVDVLENDGTWDLRKSLELEAALAAIDEFSIIPGAPKGTSPAQVAAEGKPGKSRRRAAAVTSDLNDQTGEVKREVDDRPPLTTAEIDGKLVVIFPRERFDLDVAAAIGKSDWETVLARQDRLDGSQRDRVYRDGAGFIAPLEFLSEVFFDGKPLSRAEFEAQSTQVGDVRALEVHFPRFGTVTLFDHPKRGRFISSARAQPEAVIAALP